MATKNFTISIDALVAEPNTGSLGAGADDHLPVGLKTAGGYAVRSLLKFNLDWTGVATITSAVLHLDGTAYHAATDSPNFYVKRVTSTWSEGTRGSDEVWYGDNAVEWSNQPSTTSTGHVNSTASGTGDNAITITDIVKAWAPTSIPGGGGLTNYGIMLKQTSANSSTRDEAASNYMEFESREHASGHDPYIVLTYTTNTVPNAPTLNSPINGALVSSQTPTLNFTPSDSQGDSHTEYQYQVDNNSDCLSPFEDTVVVGSFPNGVAVNRVVTTSLSRGTTYYWRVRTNDGTGYGAWSSIQSFKVMVEPTVSIVQPVHGAVAKVHFTAASNLDPRIRLEWTHSCGDAGHSQSSMDWEIYNDSAGSVGSLFASGTVSGANAYVDTATTPTRGNYYHVRLRPTCSGGVQGQWTDTSSPYQRTRVQWGRASFMVDTTVTTPNSYGTPSVDSAANGGMLVVEYATASTTTEPSSSAYRTTLAECSLLRYIFYRITMSNWGTATPTSPMLRSIEFSWNANAVVLDAWAMAGGAQVDQTVKVFGRQSLKHPGGASRTTKQTINVVAGRDYMLSGKIRAQGNPHAKYQIYDLAETTLLSETPELTATSPLFDFEYVIAPTHFNVGSNTQVVVRAFSNGTSGGVDDAWFDTVMLNEGTVALSWAAGALSTAIQVDAGGLQIDRLAGGEFRLRGSDADGLATVHLGQWGLEYQAGLSGDEVIKVRVSGDADDRFFIEADGDHAWGDGTTQDTRLGRGAADRLDVGTGDSLRISTTGALDFVNGRLTGIGSSFPGSPASNDLYHRTDLDMMFFYNGTRWLSSTLYHLPLGGGTETLMPASASVTFGWNPAPPLSGGSDIWLESAECFFYIGGGGTALGASHKWVGDLKKLIDGEDGAGAGTAVGTFTIDSGASDAMRRLSVTINALMNNGTTHVGFNVPWVKTGTPGTLRASPVLTYRIVAT